MKPETMRIVMAATRMRREGVTAARLRRVRDVRRAFFIFLMFLLVGVLATTGGGQWLVVSGFAIFIGILGLAVSLISLGVESGVEGDAMYRARLPLACLWDRTRLGAFRAPDIVKAELTTDQGHPSGKGTNFESWYVHTWLVVQPRSGAAARFLMSASTNSSPTSTFVDTAESSRAMDWLRNHGIPVDPMDAANDRRRSIAYARRFLAAGIVGTALTLVAGAIVGPTARGGAALLEAAPAVLALLGLGGWYASLWDGSRVSEAGVFSYRIPLRALWNSSELGFFGPDRVVSANVKLLKTRRSGTAGRTLLLKIRAGGCGAARFNSDWDAEAFRAASDWLKRNGIPLDDLTRD